MNPFYCVFKLESFKHIQILFYLSIFLSQNLTEKTSNSVFLSFWNLKFCLLQKVQLFIFLWIFLSSNFICSLILLMKFTQTPHLNTFIVILRYKFSKPSIYHHNLFFCLFHVFTLKLLFFLNNTFAPQK